MERMIFTATAEEPIEKELPLERTTPDCLSLAFLFGVLGSLLAIDGPWGINITVVLVALALVGAIGWHRARPDDDPVRRWGFVAAGTFSVGFTLTESFALRLFDVAAILVLLSLPLLRPACAQLGTLRPVVLLHAVLESAVLLVMGWGHLLLRRLALPTRREDEPDHTSAGPILAGVAIAGVLALLFGSLLRSADAVFDDWVGQVVEPRWLFVRIIVTLVVAWLSGGWLHGWFDRPLGERSPFPAPDPVQLAPTTVLIPLATLLLLFTGFVAVQVGYFFPGEQPTGGTVAEIARRGFFELVAVGGLALLALLIADSCLRWAPPGARSAFTVLALTLLALVGAILTSAVWRMSLYVERFGWTELRLFASVFLLFTAIALPWFGATALLGDPRRFTAGALLVALTLGGALHAISPEAVIVASHLDRTVGDREVDFEYLRTLGVDAVPAIVARWDRIPEEERERFRRHFARLREVERPSVAWTLSRARAFGVIGTLDRDPREK